MTTLALGLLCLAADPASTLVFSAEAGRFEVRGLTAAEQASPVPLTVRVAGAAESIFGTTGVSDGVVWFRPRFPLLPGVSYHASYGDRLTTTVTLPAVGAGPPTEVTHVYPSMERLPENLLKFYLHFSAPMRRGEVYRRTRLLDAAGQPIAGAFLELGEELWDTDGRRVTVFIDPGRIKRGLKPREDDGPVLEAGKWYTLEVDREWRDVAGRPLKETVRKPFTVTAPDTTRPDPAGWKLTPPTGATGALVVRFPEPLDRALVERQIWVTDAAEQRVAGRVEVGENETRWSFMPSRPWVAGTYRLHAGPALEDLAGNRIDRLFDADTTQPAAAPAVRAVPFQVADFARNWHAWRGPNADGTAPNADPPLTWDETKNIRWKAALPGRGSTTPIVWGDQVFVLAAEPTDRKGEAAEGDPKFEKKTTAPTTVYRFLVLSFDRVTGKERWRRVATEQVPHEGHHPTHSYAAGSPTTDGERLYVSFGSFGTYCYDLNGTKLWQRDLGRMNTRYGWGEAVTPVVHGDNLLLNWDQEEGSALICLDARTGKDRWRAERPEEVTSWTTPLVVGTTVVMNGTGRIRGYDLTTGKELWAVTGMTINAIPTPVVSDGVVYVMSGYRGAAAVAIKLDGGSDRVAWSLNKGTPYVPSPLLAGGRLYFTQANNALLTIVEAKTGKLLLDRERLPGQMSLYGSPIAAAGRIYLADRQGTTLVLKESDKLEVLATNRLPEGFDASPVAVGRQLFLRGEKHLYCIESR